MKKILNTKKSKLTENADFIQVNDSLSKLISEDAVCVRHFGRIHKTMEVNYEMLRNGKFGTSQTMLARGLNHLLTKDSDSDEPRVQKFDGSKLPADYQKSVAPYFGPTGWTHERVQDGWRWTGVMLKKNEPSEEIVRKPSDETSGEQRR